MSESKASGRGENGGFREPERSVQKYMSTGSAENHHLQPGMATFGSDTEAYVGQICPGSKRQPAKWKQPEPPVRICSRNKYNETGRGYFRHPVSPLTTVRESFLPFIGRPASYDVNSVSRRPWMPFKTPSAKLDLPKLLRFSSRICTKTLLPKIRSSVDPMPVLATLHRGD